ncbi:hypothetical protein GmRootA79_53350 (plasmid) [Acidovorax sp. A79]|uniref:hypothetical protein n=1 Tax=Acidovorax sp. A79 TaxID=3056107 RepID=UPI0034E886E9
MSAPQQLRHFEIVDCAVRSAEHFYLLGSHIHQLDEDCDDDGGDLAAPTDPEPDLREAMRVAVYFPQRSTEKQWAFRTVRHIEFMRGAVAHAPQAQWISVSIDGQVYALGGGVSAMEQRIPEHRCGPLRGSVRQVVEIDGHAHAVQAHRGLCRRLGPDHWKTLCADLPPGPLDGGDAAGFRCAAGSSASDIYAGGDGGDLWHFDGVRWRQQPFPDEAIDLLCCPAPGDVVAACRSSAVYRSTGNGWRKLGASGVGPYRSMVSYQGAVWCSSDAGIWRIDGDRIGRVTLPDGISANAGLLAARDGVLLVAGKHGAAYLQDGMWREFLSFGSGAKAATPRR